MNSIQLWKSGSSLDSRTKEAFGNRGALPFLRPASTHIWGGNRRPQPAWLPLQRQHWAGGRPGCRRSSGGWEGRLGDPGGSQARGPEGPPPQLAHKLRPFRRRPTPVQSFSGAGVGRSWGGEPGEETGRPDGPARALSASEGKGGEPRKQRGAARARAPRPIARRLARPPRSERL